MDSILTSKTSRLGATLVSENQTRFSLWAPDAKTATVELIRRWGEAEKVVSEHALQRDEHDNFVATIDECPSRTLYRFRTDQQQARPDPRSGFQPFGVHGPSQVLDANSFQWSDENWQGIQKRELVIYELHVGSFSETGTYAGAIEKLDELKSLGITAIEVLPLAQCPGKWNWGYDGVNYFAPNHNFGSPNELKRFVDACHHRGIAVINDVVYNHVGPEGNYLSEFGPYRSKKFGTPWGDAFDFDQPAVRQFVIDNILFWIDEYHFDGLRLDAVHYMFDDCSEHILSEIHQRFRQHENSLDRKIYLIGESNIYDPELVGDVSNGEGHYDAIWSDCLMHSIYKHGNPELRLTNRHYESTDIAEAIEHAYVFSTPQAVRVTEEIRSQNHQGDDRRYLESLIMALQTHDSVGNHPHGKRLHHLTSIEFQQSAAALVLLYPSIPMLFMGEEWSTDATFPFFADFEDNGLRQAVDKGRRDEYPHHDWSDSPLPSDPIAFTGSKSTPTDLNGKTRQWYRSLLSLRKQGIDSGWLNVENFSTESDLDNSVFKLTYQFKGRTIDVCSRLANADAEPIPLVKLSGKKIDVSNVVLNSQSGPLVEIVAHHCVVLNR